MIQEIELPVEISRGLDEFLKVARKSFGDDLVSAVLFGSAAEGRLRPTSDVNLVLVLMKFCRDDAEMLRPQLRTAHAAFRLNVMFLLEREILPAMDAFAVKFSDILARRKVLFGTDPFASLEVSEDALCKRTKQVLMNLMLRMREKYLLVSMREEQIGPVIADNIGPLRATAATILKLEGRPAANPMEAMAILFSEINKEKAVESLRLIDMIRRQEDIPQGAAADLYFLLMELAGRMYEMTETLSSCRGARRNV